MVVDIKTHLKFRLFGRPRSNNLVSSACEMSHERDLETVFKRLEDADIAINIKKSELFKQQVDFLGHQISAEEMRLFDKHVEADGSSPDPSPSKTS